MANKKPRGLAPLLEEPKPFNIGDRTFRYNKLGSKATFELINIVKSAWVWGSSESKLILSQFNMGGNLAALLAPLFGIPETSVLILDFFNEHIVELARNEDDTATEEYEIDMSDPDQCPMGAELVFAAELAQHPSVTSFLATLAQLKSHPALGKAGQYLKTTSIDSGKTASTSSNEPTA